jgi:hypothetical protein
MSFQGDSESVWKAKESSTAMGSTTVPHSGQEGSLGSSDSPQLVQESSSAPHWAQKRSPRPRLPPQCAQVINVVIEPPGVMRVFSSPILKPAEHGRNHEAGE